MVIHQKEKEKVADNITHGVEIEHQNSITTIDGCKFGFRVII